MIKKSKFVTGAEKSHKPGYRATGKALFVPSQDDATMRKLLETYFDPMTHVGHRVSSFIVGSMAMQQTDKIIVRSSDCQRTHRERDPDQHTPDQSSGYRPSAASHAAQK